MQCEAFFPLGNVSLFESPFRSNCEASLSDRALSTNALGTKLRGVGEIIENRQ